MTEDELEPKPKRKVWLIILLAIGIPLLCGVVCCGGVGFWAFTKFKDLPAAVVSSQAFLSTLAEGSGDENDPNARPADAAKVTLEELKTKRIAAAYQTTSSGFKAKMSLEQFRAFVAKHPALTTKNNPQITGMQLNEQPGVKKAVINSTITNSAGSVTSTITLVKEGDAWKVDDITVP